ncbi:MAG: MGMT family protein [Candidatus Nanoarchaeia archaeon]|jgi:methylated-DNA-[protein]-cysteine S-methyltransferase|nr:MGMT family protein [Candidatus Nanoarchaeia archaeon]|tara:strand:+ start:7206 stop:7502 length:297 start_codon:yes stop_codon:yes gene_type:complete
MEFYDKIYEKLKKVPKGRVTTYKLLAESVGSKAYRAVGRAMNKNPYAPIVPCHRVINSQGHLHGFARGLKKKKELLEKEGVKVKDDKVVNFKERLYKF